VEHLASHILGRMASRISADWQRMYGHPIYFLETFIDPERFRGTCYRAAKWVVIRHQSLKHGERCSECRQGNVYAQKDPKVLVRIVGQAPLAATVYSLERLRCRACGQVFTAEEPEGVGPEKYDETAAAMIAQLKYGSGIPFYRLERLEDQLGIPLPAATQWEIVEEAAEVIKPARDELILRRRKGMYCTTTIPACEC